MDSLIIGCVSVVLIVLLIYGGAYVAITLSFVSFLGVWLIKGDLTIAMRMMTLAVTDSIKTYDFASIPTFVMMGLVVGKAGLGTQIYDVAHQAFRRVRGGLGIATVAANAAFAAVTGSSIASASVFTRVAVPEMIRYHYSRRFAVGVVAGSSVLGMIIPPSVMMIIYAFVAEQSVGDMFLAGVIPGLLLSFVFIAFIMIAGVIAPGYLGAGASVAATADRDELSLVQMIAKLGPLTLLILIVLGGIYSGFLTASEAGAAGALAALAIAVLGRRLSRRHLKDILIDAGHITASILFLIMAATMYSRMLGIAGLPSMLSEGLGSAELSFFWLMAAYIVLLLFLGTIIDTASIILICVPLFLKTIEDMGLNLVWFGVITVIGAEVGLLTPPFGISCFVIKATLDRADISLNDIFMGALPFAVVMLLVLILLIAFPQISIGIL